jgi:cell wall-associated NlpC family hydrolase
MKASLLVITLGFLFATLFFSYGYGEEQLVTFSVGSSHDSSYLGDKILQEVSKYMGVRYKRGGSSRSGVDCSGFVKLIYRNIFYVDLPHIAAYQARLSIFDDIPPEELKMGDLIFFSRTLKKKRINHVGIYLSDGEFAHAVEAKGVMISCLSESHWKVRVKTIKRIKSSTIQ